MEYALRRLLLRDADGFEPALGVDRVSAAHPACRRRASEKPVGVVCEPLLRQLPPLLEVAGDSDQPALAIVLEADGCAIGISHPDAVAGVVIGVAKGVRRAVDGPGLAREPTAQVKAAVVLFRSVPLPWNCDFGPTSFIITARHRFSYHGPT
ncbi:MAG: hypothetical protein BWY92_01245 [Firmicutes bacterium ADurb.BinA052]|nr:MAG: hypothetical protein BWY92_01245 [Firmicutes bacterium ADurb.BinA052]